MSLLTLSHVLISLIGILTGFIAVFGMIAAKRLDGWNATFLLTTVLTSATGFFFPFHKVLPSHILGVLSLIVLAIAIPAHYAKHLVGSWRKTYTITSCIALWLNVFVLVAQLYMKVPALHALAPRGSEPPFLITQVVVMTAFIVLTIAATIKFHPEAVRAS